MTEPVAYLVNGVAFNDINRAKFYSDVLKYHKKIKIGVESLVPIPLYTDEQLHQRVKMTRAEFGEFKKLLSVGISTIYEAFDLIDSDRGEMDEFEQLYNRLFANSVNEQAKQQIEFAKLWDSLSTCLPEETIEIVPEKKWFVHKKDFNGDYRFLKISAKDLSFNYKKNKAAYFETKEEAELWTNPLTEAVQLAVEDE
ncbi:hypothetical protein [Leuconostoc mesenteroides]|uniref:hypothetical protein n=1 Tax=Leuconostoc mesenteroides TaxID=1245 RepID=UPI00236281E7|nr:hypothetical protein [Leuconostoc mesenteroides]